VVDRVTQYLASGEVAGYDDQQNEVLPAARFASLLDHSPYLVGRVPRFAEYLRRYSPGATAGVESFVYWSKERLARKAVVTVTQVNIIRSRESELPAVLVAGKQIFSTHYFNASLGLTALLRGQPGGSNYLLYINRSELDMLHGTFAGAVRWFLQRRLKGEAGERSSSFAGGSRAVNRPWLWRSVEEGCNRYVRVLTRAAVPAADRCA
jgi:hypothetical protein